MCRQLPIYCLLILLCSSLWSCQKAFTEEPETIDPPSVVENVLPQRLRVAYSAEQLIEYYSFQYDSINRRIHVFLDDTTNSNPYDQLLESYFFNERGYLIRHDKDWRNGGEVKTSLIVRDESDQIKYITNVDVETDVPDTAYYSFTTIPEGTRANIQWRNTGNPDRPGDYHIRYDFDNTQKLIRQYFSGDTDPSTFVYNGDRLKEVIDSSDGRKFFQLSYQSGLADGQVDTLLRSFLGKDYYIPQLRDMYFLTLYTDYNVFSLSMTDPHHPTTLIVDVSNWPNSSFALNFNYKLLDNNRLSQVSGEWKGEKVEVQFFYK